MEIIPTNKASEATAEDGFDLPERIRLLTPLLGGTSDR
jgi:hypothetical protein